PSLCPTRSSSDLPLRLLVGVGEDLGSNRLGHVYLGRILNEHSVAPNRRSPVEFWYRSPCWDQSWDRGRGQGPRDGGPSPLGAAMAGLPGSGRKSIHGVNQCHRPTRTRRSIVS